MGLHFIFLKPNWKQNWPHKKFQKQEPHNFGQYHCTDFMHFTHTFYYT